MKQSFIKLLIVSSLPAISALQLFGADVTIKFSGLEQGDKANLTISSSAYLASIEVADNGSFVFEDVPPGTHYVKAESTGYNVPEALTVRVDGNGSVNPATPLMIPVSKMDNDPSIWNFEWKEDGTLGGYTTTSNTNKPVEIDFLGKKIIPADVPSLTILEKEYRIIPVNDEREWTHEHAYRLLETLKTIPVYHMSSRPAKFILTSSHLEDDISVTDMGDGYEVRISEDAFCYANPFLVTLDGVRGKLFSKRLHHALVNFLTDFGRDEMRINEILTNRFGCTVYADYSTLTQGTTNEDENHFQRFHPSELVSIINMLEELPEGFHATPHLNTLIRRCDGHKHPLYPGASAVSWCQDNGYIEFMESAFGGNNQDFETLRLILHEKTHFLWAYTFPDEIKNDWIKVGGWYEDPNASEGWSTTKDTEFVSAYAHAKNPNEDMAESVAFYLKDPAKLMSRSPEKYEFICNRIMHGTRYISSIPDHLSFEVLNLFPDYDYPGKIKRINVRVDGAPEEDKIFYMEIELNDIEGFEDNASYAYTRVTSPEFQDEKGESHTQYFDIGLSPVDNNGHVLCGRANISKYSKSGHWTVGDIKIADLQGNERYEGRNDFVFDSYINNPLEDTIPPVYEENSLNYELSQTEVDGHHCQNLKVTYKVTDNIGIKLTFARIYAESESFNTGGTGLTDQYGTYDPVTHIAEINFMIPDYFPTTYYYLPFIEFYDLAGTSIRIPFYYDETIKKIHIETPTPDTNHPEIDLNRMYVYAEPTHPEAPDGETKVTINFYARDDISGVGPINYSLLDPQGNFHFSWFYHENSYTTFFDGDPTVWKRYQIIHILPRGSAPGRWGLAQMGISDKACNEFTYNFIETLIFEPDDDTSDYELFADIDNDILHFGINALSGSSFGIEWRIIHEESGQEINGKVPPARKTRSLEPEADNGISADISTLPEGDVILIVKAVGDNSEVLSIKSKKLNHSPDIMTGIHDLNADCEAEIFNTCGVRVHQGKIADANLDKGIYIIRCGQTARKVIIK